MSFRRWTIFGWNHISTSYKYSVTGSSTTKCYSVAVIHENESISKNPDYLLVLDFEATCEKGNKKIVQEIIEFPCLKIKLKNFAEESRFHYYVKPKISTELPVFCTELTGILQDMVDDEKEFTETLDMFETWRKTEHLTDSNSVYVTSGDWDLGRMLPSQCQLCNIPVPSHMYKWIDLKKLYAKTLGQFPRSLRDMVEELGLQFEGRQHSGIDDCVNIANIARLLAQKGAVFGPTSQLNTTPDSSAPHR